MAGKLSSVHTARTLIPLCSQITWYVARIATCWFSSATPRPSNSSRLKATRVPLRLFIEQGHVSFSAPYNLNVVRSPFVSGNGCFQTEPLALPCALAQHYMAGKPCAAPSPVVLGRLPFFFDFFPPLITAPASLPPKVSGPLLAPGTTVLA